MIVAEVAARDDVSRAFGEAADAGTFVERDLGDGLHHISIDPESALEEYVKDQLPRGLADVLASSRLFALPRRGDARAARAADGREGLGAGAAGPAHAGRATRTTS